MQAAPMRIRGGASASFPLRPAGVAAAPRLGSRRGRTALHATGGGSGDKKQRFEELVSKQLEALKTSGMSPQQARQTLKTWAEMGAKNEKELRELLFKRSLKSVSTLATQLLLDAGCSVGAFAIGSNLGQVDIPGILALQLVAYFGGCWYAIQAVAEAGALGAILVAARRYSTDSDAILAAVQQLAGPASGIGIVDTTKLAVNTLKVIGVLRGMSEDLKALSGSGALEPSTLRNLSAYLTLQTAREKFGFDSSAYGLTDAQAADIAAVFSEFDSNSDGRLELSELRRLCDMVGRALDDAELREALRLLGSRDAQHVYFTDFAEWYLGLKPGKQSSPAAAAAE
ncbi:hypothetical protein Rsub_01365 [Raphidocelis subcapitata]|uniref:EF-hand domain-containing protein n=1 Tax=Raphidocelis subcapitata TaxID=307507 RepID=A0A2V0NMW5_9CHLO|nr:hypothetical protein Rsub_01365 [Raphidocelis subcapitata]|eukprot:GBF88866.1 hypothetical protein Rsub_01365 [Raphidocelis subcapitata]